MQTQVARKITAPKRKARLPKAALREPLRFGTDSFWNSGRSWTAAKQIKRGSTEIMATPTAKTRILSALSGEKLPINAQGSTNTMRLPMIEKLILKEVSDVR